jgi:hypothetical protein
MLEILNISRRENMGCPSPATFAWWEAEIHEYCNLAVL